MSNVSSKTRKIIWSLSGDSCAICKQELTKKVDERHLILGQECHIRSPKANGPRYDPKYPTEKLNSPDNLMLLCRNHHKEIDDLPDKYSVETLEKIKVEHEALIKSRALQTTVYPKVVKTSKYLDATQVTSGMQLINMASGACGYGYAFDETDDNETYELIKSFLSYIEDLDVLPDIGEKNRLDMARELKNIIQDLERHGYFVFCAVSNDKLTGDGRETPWRTVYFMITTNKKIKYIIR